MPDGDKVHDKLSRRYQKFYKHLCEGKASSQESAWELMKALLHDIKQKGDNFIKTAQLMAEEINKYIVNIKFQGNLAYLSRTLEQLVKKYNCPHYDGQILINSSRICIKKLQNGQSINNLKEEIIGECFNIILESNVIHRLPLTEKHHAGMDNKILQERIEVITPEIQAAISKWSQKANQENSVKKLQVPRRQNKKPIDMDENLL